MTRYTIPADVACATVEDGAVVLHMGTKRYFSLNETGAVIWQLLEQDVPFDEIPARVSERYDVTISDARRALDELVTMLEASQLLEIDHR